MNVLLKSETKKYPEKSSIKKVSDYILCGYSMLSNIYVFYGYRGQYSTKNLCKSLKEPAMETIDFEKNKMMPLIIVQRSVKATTLMIKNIVELKIVVIIQLHKRCYICYM